MTARQMIPAVGMTVLVHFEKILVRCTVTDAKSSYGQVRLEVTPMCGSGKQWVELGRIQSILPETKIVLDSATVSQ